ncbi:hypothetical protein AB0E63_30295, partial [Kribbella sp. NPDC026596]|uniref:hypothetical protein n=1 Tax=Kribbella sp. NPDC026596 TaxID=3155122 RepID=UPI0033E1DC5A
HGWNVRRLDHKTLEWTTPHGFTFHVNPTGTHQSRPPSPRMPDLMVDSDLITDRTETTLEVYLNLAV